MGPRLRQGRSLTDEVRATVELPADSSAALVARRAVRAACDGTDADVEVVELCTSELVTNALLHGTPPIRLEISVTRSEVKVRVADRGDQPVRPRRVVTPEPVSGRGLGIVETLASAWGHDRIEQGNVVWFKVTAGAAADPSSD